ncbi:MAG: RimK-like ATPgrasp N-terminal domain-containing protein, partial [Chromatiales bacterium]|nr:RimK-like ATPgrasp N-terminal domain-containing protein [Chromatiales bacterium]
MSDHVLLVEDLSDWKAHFPNYPVIAAEDYLTRPEYSSHTQLRVINLCRSFRYLSEGYYCSLLAEARSHKVVPTVRTIQDLSRKSIYSLDTEDIDGLVQRILGRKKSGLQPTAFEMTVFFGQCAPREMQEIASQLFAIFRAPMFKAEFKLAGQWRIESIKPLALKSLTADQEPAFFEALETYLKRPWRKRRGSRVYKYDLAILQNPDEDLPPSSRKSLANFVRVGKSLGLEVDLIDRKDFTRLA